MTEVPPTGDKRASSAVSLCQHRQLRDAPSIMRAASFLQARRGVCYENTGDFTCGIAGTIVLMMA